MLKKLLCILVSISFISTCLFINYSEDVAASSKNEYYNLYPMSCSLGEFEVSEIKTDNGQISFEKVSCHSSFKEAKNVMKTNDNYVVREGHSVSPSMIIAMNSGLVYSYPRRGGDVTLNIYSTYNSGYASGSSIYTYVAEHYEMTYIDTVQYYISSLNSNVGAGWVNVVLNGFNGYAYIWQTDLVPTKIIDSGLPFYLGGNDITSQDEKPFQVICEQNYYQVEHNGNYYNLKFCYHWCYPGSDKHAYSYWINLGPAPSSMNDSTRYYSNDSVNYYTNKLLTSDSYVCTYYPYYAYLPLRSKTNLPASAFNDYIETTWAKMYGQGQVFIDAQNKYGVNALGLFSLGGLESSWGKSDIALNKNNLFGWGAVDATPGQSAYYFPSISASVSQMMGFNLRKYLDVNNKSVYAGQYFGTKGSGFNVNYASDPYWGLKIGSCMYSIDREFNNNDGNLTDYNYYTIGKTTTTNANIYSSPNTSSSVLYTTAYKGNYQKDDLFIILAENDDFYEIQTTNPVGEDGKIITTSGTDGLVDYDYDRSVGYILKSQATIINNNGKEIPSISSYDNTRLAVVEEKNEQAKIASFYSEPYGYSLTANGSYQNLVSSGSCTGGTIVYSTDGTNFSSSIPTAKDAGTYTVYYKVSGDSNHSDSSVKSTTVTINPSYIKGDVNNDGNITDADAIYLLMSVYFPNDYSLNQSGDMNNDGSVTDSDAIYLLMSVYFPNDYKLN